MRFLDGRFEHKTFFATVYSLIINRWGKGVTRLDGARGKKQVWRPPMFEPEVFRKQIYCIEDTCDIVGTFRRPHNDTAPGIVPPSALVTPLQIGCVDH